jgi:hypothetical protein
MLLEIAGIAVVAWLAYWFWSAIKSGPLEPECSADG